MLAKNKGVSLLEMTIVMLIMAVVGVGVANLSVKSVEQSMSEKTQAYQNNLYLRIQQDLRDDLAGAFSAWVDDGSSRDFIVTQACGSGTPASVTGNTLNIVREMDYNAAGPSVTYKYVRYQFVDDDGDGTNDHLIRMEDDHTRSGEPATFWPKCINSNSANGVTYVTPKYQTFPAYGGTLANLSLPDKAYNAPGSTHEEHQVSGQFQMSYGEEFTPAMGSWMSGTCSFYVQTINLVNLDITTAGSSVNKYDRHFGKANVIAPTLSFEINSSIKFF